MLFQESTPSGLGLSIDSEPLPGKCFLHYPLSRALVITHLLAELVVYSLSSNLVWSRAPFCPIHQMSPGDDFTDLVHNGHSVNLCLLCSLMYPQHLEDGTE